MSSVVSFSVKSLGIEHKYVIKLINIFKSKKIPNTFLFEHTLGGVSIATTDENNTNNNKHNHDNYRLNTVKIVLFLCDWTETLTRRG